MNKISTLVSMLCFFMSISYAQTSVDVDSKKIIQKGVAFHDEKKYAEAIIEFKKVNSNDTNFVLASVELANTYIADEQDSLAVIVCDQASVLPSSLAPSLLLYKANALDKMGKIDEAIKFYNEGIKKYPLNNSFYFELGILKYRQEKYAETHDLMVQSIKCNPYHASSHHVMANLALKQGKLIPAMLAWQYYLLLDNSSARAKSIVAELEKIAKNEYEFEDIVKLEGLSEQDDFSELEALVKSKVALTDKYKSKIKLKFNITKQMQLIFEKIEVNKSDKGFYMEFYASLFQAMNKNNYFEPYAYGILGGFDNSDVNSWLKKNKEESEKFSSWAIEFIGENVSTYECLLNGKKMVARHWYQNNKIQSVGNKNAKGEFVGNWDFYFSNGILRAAGFFNEKAQREGIWKFYYSSGLLKSVENYKDGSVEGLVENYYSNGSIEKQKNFITSKLDGARTIYYTTGGKEMVQNYKMGVQEGKEYSYYQNGKLKYEIDVVAGKYQGPLVQYYNNGHLMEKSTFKDGFRFGKYQNFYNYPENTLKIEVNYEKGTLVGEYKSYHRNGKIEDVGNYNKSGEKDGVWKNYFDTGTLYSEETFSSGKLTASSKYYEISGELIEEFIYKNDILQEYIAYDLNGKVVYQNKKDGKNNYDANLYYANGNKKREGKVLAGNLTGVWKNYNMNGYISSETNYTEGKMEGKAIDYYANGKVKSETDYSAGETNGYYRKYYNTGKLNTEGAYILDKEIGEWKTYYMNGKLEELNFYNDGNLDGWQQYFAINGKLSYEEFFELGYVKKRVFYDTTGKISNEIVFNLGDGVLETKHVNGKAKQKVEYKKNMREGTFVEFYPNGKPLSEKNYITNKVNGEVKYFFPDGKIQSSRGFLDGDRHGKHLFYYEDGTLQKEYNFIYDNQEGKAILYYPNKTIERDYEYKYDEISGKANIYSETGDLIISRDYKNGILVSYSYFDKNGVMLPKIDVKNETATIKSFFKTGTPAIEYSVKNGELVGKRMVYHSNGAKQEEENYIDGELSGIRKFYYASGKIKEEENYEHGEKIGKATSYYENGKVKSEEYFVSGKQHGISKYYDATGKLTHTYVYYNDELIDEK